MRFDYFYDHLFDLLNESDLLDLQDITAIPGGYRVTVADGTTFRVALFREEDAPVVTELFSET